MRILRSIQHKYCADGSYMKEYELSEPVTAEFFRYLGNFGKVTSMPGMGEGFYSFERKDWFSIKGFAGDSTVEVRFHAKSMDLTSDFLFFLFSSFKKDGVDIETLKRREANLSERVRVHLYGKQG